MKNPEQLEIGKKRAPGDLVYVQGFVNTTDIEAGKDLFSTTEGLLAWLQHHGLLEPGIEVTEEDRAKVVAFRDALRSLLGANNGEPLDRSAVATLEKLSAEVPLQLHYKPDGRLELHAGGRRIEAALGELQAVIYRSMLEGSWQRLKACLSETCQWVFYDASKNRSGTWCSMEVCGNRTKVRSHRERKR